jgi:hypothetical protein
MYRAGSYSVVLDPDPHSFGSSGSGSDQSNEIDSDPMQIRITDLCTRKLNLKFVHLNEKARETLIVFGKISEFRRAVPHVKIVKF